MRAAHLLRDRKDVEFVFVGEGPRKAALVELSRSLALDNVRFLPEVPSKLMPFYLSAAGCAIVPLRDEPLFRGALPSKMFEAWACSRPVMLSVAGEAADVLKQAGGGLLTKPEDAEELARAIIFLQAHPDEAATMGRSGRAYVERHYARREQARKLEVLLGEIVGSGN